MNAQTSPGDDQFQRQLLTPLHLACLAKSSDVCYFLIKHGARTDILDSEGRVPYDPLNCEEDFSAYFCRNFCMIVLGFIWLIFISGY